MTKNLDALIIDLETTVRCPVGSNKANPMWPENEIVLAGMRIKDKWSATYDKKTFIDINSKAKYTAKERLLVGSNIPFDLKYLYKSLDTIYNYRGSIRIWDCQVAEYILRRQQAKFASLDEMALKYGGTKKNDEVKKHWEAGGQTEDIDPKVLEAYLMEDLNNTELVFKAQLKEAVERGMLPLIMAQMDAVMAVTEMTYNGMMLDLGFIIKKIDELSKKVVELELEFKTHVLKTTDIPTDLIDINSPKSLSLILFGGEVKVKVDKAVGVYKNGKIKTKKVDSLVKYKGCGFNPEAYDLEKTVHGWSTDESTLEKLKAFHIATIISSYRHLSKDLGTYYNPLYSLAINGFIHQNLQQTVTNTGRLSCAEPNLQNQTDKSTSEVKKAFVSRWGNDGVLVEVDYNQLEIVALAELSRDRQLIEDVNNGVDIHAELYKNMYARSPTEQERKRFKRLSFALIYGSGIKNMAEQAGVSETVARIFKTAFHKRYPDVKAYRERVSLEAYTSRVPGTKHDAATGLPLGSGFYRLPTGRELYLQEYVQHTPYGPKTGFSYTQLCNYPVQSFATGDIVPIMFGKLWRQLVNSKYKDKALLINTVHDSIMLDVHKDVLEEVIPYIKDILETVPEVFNRSFGIEMTVRPRVSITTGPDWFHQTEWK